MMTKGRQDPQLGRAETQQASKPRKRTTVIIMGATGAGKSTFINCVTQTSTAAVGHSLRSETKDVNQYAIEIDDERDVILIDSPGFDDTLDSDFETLKTIAQSLATSYHANLCVNGILFLIDITESRMRGSSTKTLKMMQELCGTDSLSGLAFVTTKWDEGNTANYDVFESRQKQLQDDFLKESLDRGAKLERHNNTPESACTLIAQFFKRPPVALRIQTELCEQKKDLLQTSAGLVVKSDLELQREKRKGAEDKAGVAQLNNKQSEWENDSAARKRTMREKTEKVDELKQKDPENSRSTLVEVLKVAAPTVIGITGAGAKLLQLYWDYALKKETMALAEITRVDATRTALLWRSAEAAITFGSWYLGYR